MFLSLLAHFGNLAVVIGFVANISPAILGGTAGNIGLSSLAGGNDFGLFVAHIIDFYLLVFVFFRQSRLSTGVWEDVFKNFAQIYFFTHSQCTTQHYLLKELNQITKW